MRGERGSTTRGRSGDDGPARGLRGHERAYGGAGSSMMTRSRRMHYTVRMHYNVRPARQKMACSPPDQERRGQHDERRLRCQPSSLGPMDSGRPDAPPRAECAGVPLLVWLWLTPGVLPMPRGQR